MPAVFRALLARIMSLTQQPSAHKALPAARIILPFVDTGPLQDVMLALLLTPVWWWLGVEQFIWPVLFGIAAVKVLYLQHWRLRITQPVRWFALFLVAVLISGLFVEDTARQLTFVRNLGAFAAGFLALLVITNRARSREWIDKLLNVVLFVMLLAGIAGLLAAAGAWRPAIHSLIGQLLPGSVAATSYGQVISVRVLGQLSWFSGLGIYYRLNSFFLFSNHFSSALIYVIPFFFLRLSQARGVKKLLPGLSILLLLFNLILTTGRVATLSLLVGALYFSLFHSLYRRTIRGLVAFILTLAVLLLLFTTVLEMTSVSGSGGVLGQTSEVIEQFTFARGEGSFTNRSGVYEATLAGFRQRPLFGWGTERDVEGLNIPAGSHSEYLAALYRQGLLGFVAIIGLMISVWLATRPPGGTPARSPAGAFLRYGRWFFVASLINSIMTDPSVDSTTYVLLWVLLALLISTAQLIRRPGEYAFPDS